MPSSHGQSRQEIAVYFERLLPGSIDRIWTLLTESEHVAAWFGHPDKQYAIAPYEGGTIRLADDHIRGIVTQWKPPRRLTYTWNVYAPGATESPYPESYVTFELDAEGDEVRLMLTHHPVLQRFDAQTMMGWHSFLDLLESLARDQPLESLDAVMQRNKVRYGVTELRQ